MKCYKFIPHLIPEFWRVQKNFVEHHPFHNKPFESSDLKGKFKYLCSFSVLQNKGRNTVSWKLTAMSILGERGSSFFHHSNFFYYNHNCMPQWNIINLIKWNYWTQMSWLLSPYLKPVGSIWIHYKHQQKCLQTKTQQSDKKH